MTVELSEVVANQVREIAAALRRTPDSVANEVFSNGMEMLHRYAAMKERSKTVDVQQVVQRLIGRRNDHPTDAGDEVPDDLKEWVAAQRSATSA